MCSECMTFGVSAIAAITSSVKSLGCGLVKRTRSRPSISPQARSSLPNACRSPNSTPYELTFWPSRVISRTPSATSASTSARMSPGRRSFSVPRSDGTMQNVQVLLHPTRDRDPGGVRRLAPGRQGRREHVQRLEDLDLRLVVVARPLEQHRQRPDVVRAEDDVDPRRPAGDLAAVLLRQAAPDGDLHARAGRLDRGQLAEVAVEPVVGVLANGARVEHDDVGRLALRARAGSRRARAGRTAARSRARSSGTRRCGPRSCAPHRDS